MLGISPQQRVVLDFIIDYIEKHGVAPTQKEIQAGANIQHNSHVRHVLDALEKKRYISWTSYIHRGIKVLRTE